jgi:uncharacterized OsmC-like protein
MASLEVRRVGQHEFTGHNDRGAEVKVGRSGAPGSFSPGELLQLAVAACSAVTAENLITRRVGEDSRFRVAAGAEQQPGGHEYDALRVAFDVDLSGLDEPVRAQLESTIRHALDQLCTVTRTVEAGTPVKVGFDHPTID